MHYDKKISVALGIFLIGIVGAFFFRNEQKREGITPPQLENPQRLDEQIARKSVRPYETVSHSKNSTAPQKMMSNPLPHKNPSQQTVAQKALHADAARLLVLSTQPTTPSHLPAPIQLPQNTVRNQTVKNQTVINNTVKTKPQRPSPINRTKPNRNNSRNNEQNIARSTKTYRVQPGDTLTGIALRFLGSSRRYQEIFIANRDQLRNPNDLRMGIVLRIPTSQKKSAPRKFKEHSTQKSIP